MELQFWGAAQTVTGSMHILRAHGYTIVLDCGLYQGRRKEAFEHNRNFPLDPGEIDAVILSHAHIDHAGNLPTLIRQGYRGPIWSTYATRDLCAIMLPDSAHIQEYDVRYINKGRHRRGQRAFEPLYNQEDAVETLNYFHSVGYNRPFYPVPGLRAVFQDAGHILGSASITLDIDEGGPQKRLVFSGDIGRRHLPILNDPVYPTGVDFMIMESTYGQTYHESPDQAKAALKEAVLDIHSSGGKLIIPAFAVGRSQEIIYTLYELIDTKAIPPIEVYVDSPLAVNATEVFRLHPELYDQETRDFLNESNSRNPFSFAQVQYIRQVEDSKALNDLAGPAIIISASGMCEAGRILHHLKNNITDPRNIILFVSFQAEHTLGRKILSGQKVVPILGDDYPVKARIMKINGYSAHADHNGLLNWIRAVQAQSDLKQLFLVHGELNHIQGLAEAARQEGVPQVHIPAPKQDFLL